jgi:hypothetical protein
MMRLKISLKMMKQKCWAIKDLSNKIYNTTRKNLFKKKLKKMIIFSWVSHYKVNFSIIEDEVEKIPKKLLKEL